MNIKKYRTTNYFLKPSRHYGISKATEKEEFMKNLCPAWADRVLYNEKLNDLFRHVSSPSNLITIGDIV